MIRDIIKKYRKRFGISQVELSKRLNIEQSHYSYIENKGLKSFDQATDIIKAMGVDSVEIILKKGDKKFKEKL